MSNADQAAFWTAQDSWIRFQTQMDQCIQPVLDLVMDRANLVPGQHVLDIGCGTGASVEALARVLGPYGSVLGVDIAPTLLDIARQRTRELTGVRLIEADVQTAAMPHLSDAAISWFGVMFFSDNIAAFSNILRQLNPGASMTCAAWAAAKDNPFFMAAAQAARDVFGPMPKTDRSLPGPFAFEDPERVRNILEQSHWEDIVIDTVDLPLTPASDLTEFAQLCMAIGPAASAIAHFDPKNAELTALSNALVQHFSQFQSGQRLLIPASIHVFSARTPN